MISEEELAFYRKKSVRDRKRYYEARGEKDQPTSGLFASLTVAELMEVLRVIFPPGKTGNLLPPTSPIPAGCKRKRSAVAYEPRGSAPRADDEPPAAGTSGPCHEAGGSSRKEEEKKMKKKKKKERRVKKARREVPEPFQPQDMPQDLRHHIEDTLRGTGIILTSQKKLMATDVSSYHKRIFLPKATSLEFLNEVERAEVERPSTRDVTREVLVKVLVDPRRGAQAPAVMDLKPRTVSFRRWDLKKKAGQEPTTVYVLTTGAWSDLVKDNKLEAGDVIQIWSFRVGVELHMAVVRC